jgi:serine/threonine protein kinase
MGRATAYRRTRMNVPSSMIATRGNVLPRRIGRFPVEDMVGYGLQGVVLLATDPELGRKVAIKVLRPSAAMLTDSGQLVEEARVVSQLQHPNIVTLYEMGQHHGLPYLVFEYVDGESLADLIAREGALPCSNAVILMSQILSGVVVAHEHGVVHRDLSPSNILITNDYIPKITDFGLSTQNQPRQDGNVVGSLRYMSPERLYGEAGDAASDVFALGAIFFEMLVGRHLIDGDDQMAVMHKLVSGFFEEPSRYNPRIEPLIDKVVGTALQSDRAFRYVDARAMKSDLDVYRVPRANSTQEESAKSIHASVEFLLRRMTYKKGFSVLSQRISEIQHVAAEDSSVSARQLANIIAKDIVLTQRVLTTANSAYIGRGNITKVTRAIVVLGLERVRMCITSAMLETHLGDNSPELQDALLSSFFSGVLAKHIALIMHFHDQESVFIAAMFHNLGRTLVIHYFEDEYAAITELIKRDHIAEVSASRRILGVAYHEVGVSVAKAWKFPDDIITAMSPLPQGLISEPDTLAGWLQCYAAFANGVARVHDTVPVNAVKENRNRLVERMSAVFPLSEGDIDSATTKAIQLTSKYSRLMRLPPSGSKFLAQLERWEELETEKTQELPVSEVDPPAE